MEILGLKVSITKMKKSLNRHFFQLFILYQYIQLTML